MTAKSFHHIKDVFLLCGGQPFCKIINSRQCLCTFIDFMGGVHLTTAVGEPSEMNSQYITYCTSNQQLGLCLSMFNIGNDTP